MSARAELAQGVVSRTEFEAAGQGYLARGDAEPPKLGDGVGISLFSCGVARALAAGRIGPRTPRLVSSVTSAN
jgi:hypothetical protein